MGIETTPDVEESTEPPICGFTNSHSHAARTSLSFESCDPKEKPTTLPPQPTNKSTPVQQQVSNEQTERSEDRLRNAHLLEISDLASLLGSDLQYVMVIHCPSLSLSVSTREMSHTDIYSSM